jgi:predicted RND superfamily exporter protein
LKPDDDSTPARLLRGPVRRPGTVLVLAAGIIVLAAMSITRLQPSGSLESMMAQSDPSAAALGRILRDFAPIDNLLLIARLPKDAPADPELLGAFAQRFERAVEIDADLRSKISNIRFRLGPSPQEREFFEKHVIPAGLYYLNAEQFARLMERLTPESMREQTRRNEELIAVPGPAANALSRVLQKDPLRLREFLGEALTDHAVTGLGAEDGLLLSDDRRSLLIRIAGRRSASDLDFTKVFLPQVQTVADDANIDGLKLEYSGAYAIAAASEHAIRSDMIRSVIASVILMQLVFLVMHRMALTFAVAFIPTAIAIVVAFGVYALIRTELTPATAVVGAIIAGLGVDYSVHLLSHYAQSRKAGAAPADAAQTSIGELFVPMLAAASTTLIGVLAISLSPVRALRDFSTIAVFGLGGALVATFTILPALLIVVERMSGEKRAAATRFGARYSFVGVTSLIDRHARGVLALSGTVWIAAVVFLAKSDRGIAPIQSDLTVLHPRPNPALDLQERIAREFNVAANSLLVHLQADSAEELTTAAHRVAAASRNEDVRAAGVRGVYGVSALLPDPSQIETRRAQIQQIDVDQVRKHFRETIQNSNFSPQAYSEFEVFLARFLTASAPPDLNMLPSYEQVAATVLPRPSASENTPRFQAISLLLLERPLADRAARDQAIEVIRGRLADTPSATLTGLTVISHDIERLIYADLKRQSLVAATAVIALLAIFVRHPLHLLLVLMPTALGLTSVLLGIHVFDDGFNMINLVGIPLLMGIGDNFGIFVVDVFRRHRREGAAARDLPMQLAPSVRAIVLTSATTILGFSSLMFTSTPAIQSLGRLTAIGVAACLAGTLFVLMPITFLMARRKEAL